MKVVWKRYLALVLAVCLVISCGVFSSDRFLRATDGGENVEDSTEAMVVETTENEEVGEVVVLEQGTFEEPTEAEVEDKKEETETVEEKVEEEVEDTEEPENPKADSSESKEDVADGNLVDKPAASVTVSAKDGAKITVDAPKGTLPEGFTVKAVPVDSAKYADMVEKKTGEQVVSVKVYDITIYDKAGKEIQPSSEVKITIEAPGMENANNASAFHVQNGVIDKIVDTDAKEATIKGDHFSEYGIALFATKPTITGGNEVFVGKTLQLTAEGFSYTKQASWSSSKTSVATVSSSGLVTAVGVGETTITYSASKNNSWFSDSESARITVTVKEDPNATSKVAVYVTDGTKKRNADIEELLKLKTVDDNGYYPVGVVEIPKRMLLSSGACINTDEDLKTVMKALENMSTAELNSTYAGNKGNLIASNRDKIRQDKGGTSSSGLTGLFYIGSHKGFDGDISGYHLDLRFLTTDLKFTSVYEQNNGTFKKGTDGDLGTRKYLAGTETKEPGTSTDWYLNPINAGYSIEGYYTDAACTKKFEFGNELSANTNIYVKLIKQNVKITYDLDGGSVSDNKTSFDAKVGDSLPTLNGLPTKEDCDFIGWTDGTNTYATNEELKEAYKQVQKSLTLKAVWDEYAEVAVYATDGTKTFTNTFLKDALNIKHVQDDGYAPIGVIKLSKKFFDGKTQKYILNGEDWKAVEKAITGIDTSRLIGKGTENSGNAIAANLDKVQADVNAGSGSHKTALFDWNQVEHVDSYNGNSACIATPKGNYKYHLDLRFATKLITYVGVESDGTEVELGKQSVFVGTTTTQPTDEDTWVLTGMPEGFVKADDKYYDDNTLNKEFEFGHPLTEDTQVYIKIVKGHITIEYDVNGGTTSSTQTKFENLKAGDDMPTVADPTKTGYNFKGWQNANGEAPGEFVVNTDKFVAQWEARDVVINYNNPTEGGKVDNSKDVFIPDLGENPNGSTATPEEGYHFDKWVDEDGNTVSEDPTLVPTKPENGWDIDKETTYTPVFEKDFTDEVKVIANSDEVNYNGNEQSVSGYTVTGLPAGYTVSGVEASAKGTDAATYTAKVTGTVVIKKGDRDVTAWFKNVTTEAGKLTINPRKVELVSASDSKVYDGTPLTNDKVTVAGDGFVNGDGATYTVTGTVTAPNTTVDNTFTYALNDGTKASNYTITQTLGKLTIVNPDAKFDITVVANSATKMYNGAIQSVSGVTVKGLNENFTIENVTASASGKDYVDNGYDSVVDITNAVVKDSAGNDVTGLFNIKTEDGKLTITKRKIHIKSHFAVKQYDGKPLTDSRLEITGEGFADGEGAEIKAVGSQTVVGTSKNTISIKLNDGTLAKNYIIEKEECSLIVQPRETKYEVNVIAKSSTDNVYDGTEKSVEGYYVQGFNGTTFTTSDGNTYTIEGLTASAARTDAGEESVVVEGTAVIKDSQGNDVSNQFAVTPIPGTFKIAKRNVVITSASATKEYDGNTLVKNNPETDITISSDGFAEGEGATFVITGSQLLVGTSENTYETTLISGTKADNYNITENKGTLTVTNREAKYEITVVANSNTAKYDGTEKTVSGFETLTFEVEGNTYTVSGLEADAVRATDAGTYPLNITGTAVVTDSHNNNVTDQFAVKTTNGSLVITKRELTLTSATASKEYDGDPLTNDRVTVSGDGFADGEGATYNVTGTQTLKGSSENTFTYSLNDGTKAENYIIHPVNGTLTVTTRDAKYQITVVANSATAKYDGTEKTVNGLKTLTFKEGKHVYTVSGLTAEGKGTDAGTYAVNVTGTAVVKDADNNDVTEQFSVLTQNGSLVIGKRNVTLTSATDEKQYDGSPLTNVEVTVGGEGFAKGEGATYEVTGSQTLKGSSDNTFTYSLNSGTNADNYVIEKTEGKLTVKDRETKYEITVKGNDGTFKYDGDEHTVSGVEQTEFEVDGHKYTVENVQAETKGTDAGTYESVVTGTPKVVDENGNDVTDQFEIKTPSGTLTIEKRKVKLTSATDSKKYDGTALTNITIEVSGDGFADKEGATYTVTGTQTIVGSSENTFTYALNDGTNSENYTIETANGILTVVNPDAKLGINIVAKGGNYTYDGTEKYAGGFETTEFTVNGKIFTVVGLTAEAKGTDAGTYPVNVVGTATVYDENGNDVTEQFAVRPTAAELNIAKRSVIITSASAEKVYDGHTLTANDVEITGEGFVGNDGATYTFTGKQTVVGVSENFFTYELVEGTNEDNYDISTVNGTLNVLNRGTEDAPLYEITLTPKSDTVIYNGQEQSVSGFETTTFEVEGKTYTVTGVEVVAKGTEAGVYQSVASGKAVVTDEEGNDVSDQFAVHIGEGSLTIRGVHLLTINYVDENGNKLAPSYTAKVVVGEKFGPIDSPEVEGYTPAFRSVSSGEDGMPDQDVTVDVVYTADKIDVPGEEEIVPGDDDDTPDDDDVPDDDNTVIDDDDDNGGDTPNNDVIDDDDDNGGDTPNNDVIDNGDDNNNNNNNNNGGNNGGNNRNDVEETTPVLPDDSIDNGDNTTNNIEDEDVPQGAIEIDEDGNAKVVAIDDEDVPQGASEGTWALLNLIVMIVTVILTILLLVTYFIGKKKKEDEEKAESVNAEEEDDEKTKRHGIMRICSIIPAIAAVVAFIITEDMRLKMVFTDKWTLLMIIILLIDLLLAVLSAKTKEDNEDDQNAPTSAEA